MRNTRFGYGNFGDSSLSTFRWFESNVKIKSNFKWNNENNYSSYQAYDLDQIFLHPLHRSSEDCQDQLNFQYEMKNSTIRRLLKNENTHETVGIIHNILHYIVIMGTVHTGLLPNCAIVLESFFQISASCTCTGYEMQ